ALIALGKLADPIEDQTAGRGVGSQAVERVDPEYSAGTQVLDRRLEFQSFRRSRAIGIRRSLAVPKIEREAMVFPLLNLVELLRMIGHRSMLGVDQAALVIPVKPEGVAVTAREDFWILLAARGIESEDAGSEFAGGNAGAARHFGIRRLCGPADVRLF